MLTVSIAEISCKESQFDWCSSISVENRNQWLDRTQMVLFGHRSIVNQVRYNYQKCLIASSGVEKIIKVRLIVVTRSTLATNSNDFFPDLVTVR
jgi:hypothetical protein